MPSKTWEQLLAGWPWFHGDGRYSIPAYSEFLPPPRLGRKAYSAAPVPEFEDTQTDTWPVTEYEEAMMLQPGMLHIARQFISAMASFAAGRHTHGITRAKLENNPYWPDELASRAGTLGHERFVVLMPLALSRTQDDKGRTPWTLFGASEQGPAKGFWRGFYSAPGTEWPHEHSLQFIRGLLASAYAEPKENLADLHRAGFRVLPDEGPPLFPYWQEGPLPSWTTSFLWSEGQHPGEVRYLLTFRPFGRLPHPVRQAYLAGKLHLLPFPGSLIFWGCRSTMKLQSELPFAMQMPLLQIFERHEAPFTIRIPQSGWLHEAAPGEEHGHHHGPVRNIFRRTSRWSRVLRDQDELALQGVEDKVTHVLFSPLPDDVGLYDKPMGRNVQVWTEDFRRLLDGPNASRVELEHARHTLLHCDNKRQKFGYRFQYPAMRVGLHELYWHRPLVGFLSPETGHPQLVANAPLGYLTAYRSDQPDLSQPLELSPRLLRREFHVEAVETLHHCDPQKQPRRLPLNVHKLFDAHEYLGGRPLLRSFARQLLTAPKQISLDDWLGTVSGNFAGLGAKIAEGVLRIVQPEDPPLPKPLTFGHTSKRAFEVNYWRTIAFLADGKYLTKNNADCVRDTVTQHFLPHHHRDLDSLGDYLLDYYRKLVRKLHMADKAVVGDLPFHWQTEWDYEWWGGWLGNRDGKTLERDLIVVIPGRDRSRAVIMADHYDTAYMADIYEPEDKTKHREAGARIPAAGADDNHSATAALMLGAPIFLELSRQGKLDCDIWLIHLTGEEFPADCLGARKLTQWLVEGNLQARLEDGSTLDLSATRVQGVYVLDMIAHNNDHDRDVFQIAPGASAASMWLALQAHLAGAIWNQKVKTWNRRSTRRNKGRGHRNLHGSAVPHVAEHLALHGEVRPAIDPHSTLYNTDGQIFSDAGVPVVLFMENYDINRTGYHDTHDTMANIDLDYGAALAAITIETVARAASSAPDG